MTDTLATEIIKDWEALKGDRLSFDYHWQEVSNFVVPDRNDYIVERAAGQKRMQRVYDATPIWANQQFAAGLHSLLTSPTLPWFSLVSNDDRLNNIYRVRQWLQQATVVMYSVFNSTRNNFATMSGEAYIDVGSIGQAAMFILSGRKNKTLFSTRSMKECVLAQNDEDETDKVIRNWKWTARQALAAWGAAAGDKVGKAKDGDKFSFIHAIRPRQKRDPQRSDNKNMPWESVYVNVDEGTVISESGFRDFPCVSPGFSRLTGEPYARGPGMYALPDIKMLNELAKIVVKAAQKVIDPPLMVPDGGFLSGIKTVPGSFNFYRAGTRDKIEPIRTEGDIKIGLELLNGLREQIKRGFYVDLLRLPVDPEDPASSGKGSTATYWSLYRSKEFLALSPMLSRMQKEFAGPAIDIVFNKLWRQSQAMKFAPGSPFPMPPDELNGVPLEVEYLSPIAVAQKTSELDAVGRLMAMQEQLARINPKATPIIDDEGIMRGTADDLNAPYWVLKSPEVMAQQRQLAAQAQDTLNQNQNAANMAGAAKDGAAAVKSLSEARAAGGGQQLQEAA